MPVTTATREIDPLVTTSCHFDAENRGPLSRGQETMFRPEAIVSKARTWAYESLPFRGRVKFQGVGAVGFWHSPPDPRY